MFPIYFSALLRGEEGRLLEPGEACVSRGEDKVTFKSEFVPLVKLGTWVEIVRVLGEKELERFAGQVYLSSRNLLQIVGVEPAVMAAARRLFDINTCLPAYCLLSPNGSGSFNTKKAETIAGNIRYLSNELIKLSAMPYIGEGQHLLLESEAPLPLKATMLRVEHRELLGRRAAILLCSVVSQPEAERKLLSDYVTQLNRQEPDIDLEATPPELAFLQLAEAPAQDDPAL